MADFKRPPPNVLYQLSFPAPQVLLVTLNRPQELNCINAQGNVELHQVWTWMDEEPSLRVGVLTGLGRAFCVGADLKDNMRKDSHQRYFEGGLPGPQTGFGGLSGRQDRKPVICAVNGICLGGGVEIVVNSDIVVAASSATFGLPEVKFGMVAVAGALPRLVRTVGKKRAMDMVLTGRTIQADEAERWGLVNDIVEITAGTIDDDVTRLVVDRALQIAGKIAGNSPDAVYVARESVKMSCEALAIGAEDVMKIINEGWAKRLHEGQNSREGFNAFLERRTPVWVDSKL